MRSLHSVSVPQDRSAWQTAAEMLGIAALLAYLLLIPYPYGAILPSGTLRLELLGFAAALFAYLAPASHRRSTALRAAAACAVGVAALGALQLLPLPPRVLRALSPASAAVYHRAAAVLGLYGGRAPAPRVSLSPSDTLGTTILLLAYVAAALAAFRLLRTRPRRRVVLAAVFAAAFAQIATVGSLAEEGRLHGSFVNPDHCAAYLEIPLFLALGVLWTQVLRVPDAWRRHLSLSSRVEKSVPPLAGAALLWGFCAAGIVLTRSRGGMAAASAATLAVVATALARRSEDESRRLRWAALPVLALGVAFVAAATKAQAIARFLAHGPDEIAANLRFAIWTTSLRAWRRFPLFGAGLGSFREAFVQVQPPSLSGLVEQGHSDGLQILVTGGAIGFLLAAAAFAIVLAALWRALPRRRSREDFGFALGVFGALVSLLLHGLVESSFSVPAIPATLLCLAGAALSRNSNGGPRRPDETSG